MGAGDRFLVGRPERAAAVDAPVAPAAAPAVHAALPAPAALAVPAASPAVVVASLPLETVTGEASYYASGFEGRRTASGAPLRNAELVAAHPHYPFGTVLRVTNTSNERSVEVTVVDRGPFGSPGRIVDLSRAAAERLAYMQEGLADVQVEVLSWGDG